MLPYLFGLILFRCLRCRSFNISLGAPGVYCQRAQICPLLVSLTWFSLSLGLRQEYHHRSLFLIGADIKTFFDDPDPKSYCLILCTTGHLKGRKNLKKRYKRLSQHLQPHIKNHDGSYLFPDARITLYAPIREGSSSFAVPKIQRFFQENENGKASSAYLKFDTTETHKYRLI